MSAKRPTRYRRRARKLKSHAPDHLANPREPENVVYHPRDFGHPHQEAEAEPQTTEAFHWQYPNWAQPGYQLYYYHGYGFFDHPLYMSQTPDGGMLVCSYGTGARFNKPPVSEPTEFPVQRHRAEMVHVYYLDEFMEEVPLKTLTRFSRVAAIEFRTHSSVMRYAETIDGSSSGDRSVSRHSTKIDFVTDEATWIPLAGSGSSTAPSVTSCTATSSTTMETWLGARGRSGTNTTELTFPDDFDTPSTVKARTCIGRKDFTIPMKWKGRKKELRVDLDVLEQPSQEAVLSAIAWMKSNEHRHGNDTLPYGPPDLSRVPLEDLIDWYQTARAFEIQPWPVRLKIELNERITQTHFDLRTFQNITHWLPLGDSCLTRTLNSLDDRIWRGWYSQAEVDAFEEFLAESGNEVLKARVDELRIIRQQRRDQIGEDRHMRCDIPRHEENSQPESNGKADEDGPGEEQLEAETPTSTQREGVDRPSTSAPRGHRRRRRQQRERRGLGGQEVSGANYE